MYVCMYSKIKKRMVRMHANFKIIILISWIKRRTKNEKVGFNFIFVFYFSESRVTMTK